jgi:hypothetical protein
MEIPEKDSQKEETYKNAEIKTGQFVCFDVLEFESINCDFSTDTKENYKTYRNIKCYYHSWYKRGSMKSFIVASNEMSLGSEILYRFICDWQGAPLKRDLIEQLTTDRLKELTIGLNAIIEYRVGNGSTQILRIAPVAGTKIIIPIKGLKVPQYLINRPLKVVTGGLGFGSMVGAAGPCVGGQP